jgi:hypothetical protein
MRSACSLSARYVIYERGVNDVTSQRLKKEQSVGSVFTQRYFPLDGLVLCLLSDDFQILITMFKNKPFFP